MEKENLEILRFLYREKKWILGSVILAALLSVLLTSTMEKKYKATATVFPPGFNSADRMLENPQFGYNIEADRLIQIGQSINFKDSVIKYFNLVEYYEIDQGKPDWKSRLLKKYESDIDFERTKYMSVQISVKNRDADQAAAMVKEMMNLMSRFWERLFKDNMLETLKYAEKRYINKQLEVNRMLDSIDILRGRNTDESLVKLKRQMDEKKDEIESTMSKLAEMRSNGNFYDYGSKIDLYSEELLNTKRIKEVSKARMTSLEKSGNEADTSYLYAKSKYDGAREHEVYLEKEMKNLKSMGKEYQSLQENLEIAIVQYNQAKSEYEKLLYSFEPLVESVELDYLEANYVSERNALNNLKEKYEKAHRYYNEPLPNLFVIENPRPVYKKDSPSYLMNLVIGMTFAFFASIAFLLFLRGIRMIRKELE